MNGMRIKVGNWIEKEPRNHTEHTSYAADHIEHVIKPGKYAAYVTIETGFMVPMPQHLLATVDSEIVSGVYYSGFGGVNYASTPAKLGPSQVHLQDYSYSVKDAVAAGQLELLPEFTWLLDRAPQDYIHEHGDWDYIRAIVERQKLVA